MDRPGSLGHRSLGVTPHRDACQHDEGAGFAVEGRRAVPERTHSPNPLLGKNRQDSERRSANFVRQGDLDPVQGGVNRLPQVVVGVEASQLS